MPPLARHKREFSQPQLLHCATEEKFLQKNNALCVGSKPNRKNRGMSTPTNWHNLKVTKILRHFLPLPPPAKLSFLSILTNYAATFFNTTSRFRKKNMIILNKPPSP
jgi:hypothetical protein